MQRTLLVEPEGTAAETLHSLLVTEGHTVHVARDGMEALRLFYSNEFDLMLIGSPVHKLDTVDFVKLLRGLSRMPILIVQRQRDPELVIGLLEAGADHVLAPSAPDEEILARIRASTRQMNQHRPDFPEDQGLIVTGHLVIDRVGRHVSKRGRPVSLTSTEYRLLDALTARAGRVAPHGFLLGTVWGEAYVDDRQYLRMYIGYLRAKLEDDPANPEYLHNDWGVGYRLVLVPPHPLRDAGDATAELEPAEADLVSADQRLHPRRDTDVDLVPA